MNWNAPQHSYEEIRDVVVQILLEAPANGVNQFQNLLEYVGREFGRRGGGPPLQTGYAYAGAASQLHKNDSDIVVEIVWDLFRQGIVTLGLDSSNPGWPWLRLSRFGVATLMEGRSERFHDTQGFLKLVRSQVPDVGNDVIRYLEEAVSTFYTDCMLASCVMLGVAAEADFIRMLQATAASRYGSVFAAARKGATIHQQITKFQVAIRAVLPSLEPRRDFEDFDTNLSLIQSVLRISRNESGHPSGARTPQREQVYVYLQLFIPYAKQLMRLRAALV